MAKDEIAAMRTLAIAAQLQCVRVWYHRKTGRVRVAREDSDSGSLFLVWDERVCLCLLCVRADGWCVCRRE